MANVTEATAQGSGSATIAGAAGKTLSITRITAHFTTAGQSGTLSLVDNGTSATIWSGVVYGALDACFVTPFSISYGNGATASLSDGEIQLSGYTE